MKTITLISLANALLFCTLYTLAAPLPASTPYSPASDRRTAPSDVCHPSNQDTSNNPVCNPDNYDHHPNSSQTGSNTSNRGTNEYPESTKAPQTTDKRKRDLVLQGRGSSELNETRDNADADANGETRIRASTNPNSKRSNAPRTGGVGSMYPKDGAQER